MIYLFTSQITLEPSHYFYEDGYIYCYGISRKIFNRWRNEKYSDMETVRDVDLPSTPDVLNIIDLKGIKHEDFQNFMDNFIDKIIFGDI